MFISKKHLPRRTFLRSALATVSLPLLDAMIPASTALAQTAAVSLPRMGFFYFPHGAVMGNWTPDKAGSDFELKSLLAPLEKYKSHITIVSNLENKRAYGPVHAITPGTWLTAAAPRISHEPFGGTTIDQIAAKYIGQDTPLPSIEVATETSGAAGSCDRAYGCSYAGTISFRTPTTPLPMENNPRKLFQTLFGVGDNGAERERIGKQTSSVLDLMITESNALNARLGAADRVVLSDYLETVREVERRVQKTAEHDLSHMTLPDAPLGIPGDFDSHINLMMDMILLAYQGNITRIANNQGRQDARGQGFELRTDAHGAIRAQDGLLISTEARTGAQAHITDMGETTSRLTKAREQHETLGDLAQQHRLGRSSFFWLTAPACFVQLLGGL